MVAKPSKRNSSKGNRPQPDRMAEQTEQEINQRLHRQMQASLAYHAQHPDQIDRRLAELEEEWDIERALQVNSSALTLGGLVLSILGRRRWLLLSLLVQGFFMQHAIQGWCPPLPLLRRLGFRTRGEIDQEKYALKALRGDFDDLAKDQPDRMLDRLSR